MGWVKRIIDAILCGRTRHELSNAARASTTDRSRIEPALLPNQIGEKGEGQIVGLGSGHKRVAEPGGESVRSFDSVQPNVD